MASTSMSTSITRNVLRCCSHPRRQTRLVHLHPAPIQSAILSRSHSAPTSKNRVISTATAASIYVHSQEGHDVLRTGLLLQQHDKQQREESLIEQKERAKRLSICDPSHRLFRSRTLARSQLREQKYQHHYQSQHEIQRRRYSTITTTSNIAAAANSAKEAGSAESAESLITLYTPSALQTRLSSSPSSPKILLIDVREPAELLSSGIIPGAINIPITSNPDAFHLSADEFETRFGFERPFFAHPSSSRSSSSSSGLSGSSEAENDRGDREGEGVNEMIFYCKAGVRSRTAARFAAREWTGVDNEGTSSTPESNADGVQGNEVEGRIEGRIGDLKGGWTEWVKSGGEVQTWKP